MPTLIEYVKGVWTSLLPATVKAKMENIEDGVKDACDVLDLETDAGRSMAQAANAAAQRVLLNVEDGADVTDEANVTAIANATAEVTAAPAHWWVLVGGVLKRMTQAGWTALVLVATGKTNLATGYTLAGGTTPKTLTVSADADTATIPNATGKSAAENIGGKTGASEAIKLGVASAEAIETGTATATPNDTDALPGVKADHSLLKYTWANIKAAIWTALGGLIAGGTSKDTPVDADTLPLADSASSSATKKLTWANVKATIWTSLGALIAAGTNKATPLDADTLPLADSAASSATKKLTWANVKATLKAYFDTLYPTLAHASRHQHGGADEIATATPAANVIPKAGAAGTLAAGFLPAATTSAQGASEFATAAELVTGTDTGRSVVVSELRTAADTAGFWLTKRTKMPDGIALASAVYYQDAFATTDSWAANYGALSVVSGALRSTSSGVNAADAYRSVSGIEGKTAVFRIRASKATNIQVRPATSGSTPVATISVGTSYIVINVVLPVGTTAIRFYADLLTTSGDYFEIDWVWCGDYSYLAGTLSEEAARVGNQLADTAGVGVAARGTLTSNGTQPAPNSTVTIGGKVYTFVSALSLTRVEGEVLINSVDAAGSLLNLIRAIVRHAPENLDYNGTTPRYNVAAAHPLISGNLPDTLSATKTITALLAGMLGNQITVACSTSPNSNITVASSTLTGGIDDVGKKIITQVENNIAGSGTRPAAAKIELANTALIGYETTVDVAKDATFTLPAGGTWFWNVYGYGATISSAKRGSSAGGTTLTVAGANASVGYRRTA